MASGPSTASDGQAWLYSSASGGLEKNLKIGQASLPAASSSEVRIEVLAASLNPIDYKLPELPIIGTRITKLPASPCKDFAGKVVSSTETGFRPGDRVFGRFGAPIQYGALSQYINAASKGVARLPDQLSFEDGAALATAGITALQSLELIGANEGAGAGKTVLINGASGGVGAFTVQIAKILGAKVVAVCSGANAQLVRELGADEVIDYRATDVLKELISPSRRDQFDLIVDNVGTSGLHKTGDVCLKVDGAVVQVGAGMTFGAFLDMLQSAALPSILGGPRRRWKFLGAKDSRKDLEKLAEWAVGGRIRVLVDSAFAYGDAPKAFERLRTGRARGKIVVSSSI